MTIKEIEEQTGMVRANIRYYEAEGLVVPERNKENGYRVYSRDDLLALRKIKLLRSLDIPLEEVRRLQQGQTRLQTVLQQHLVSLEEKRISLARAGEVTQAILDNGEDYACLDAGKYLAALESGGESLRQDVQPRLNLPWRRFWARDLDYTLCALLVHLVLKLFPFWSSLQFPLALAALLFLEPLCLTLFATTPGKAVFGIRVLSTEEDKLSYGEALVRTWTVLWEGEAMRIPFVTLYFHYKSYVGAENDQVLPWEWDSDLIIRDDRNWRYLLYFVLLGAAWAAQILLV